MYPIVYINCSSAPFLQWIMEQRKPLETRNRPTLDELIGLRVFLAESGRKNRQPSLVRCSAVISGVQAVSSCEEWAALRPLHMVPAGSQYDWQPGTKVKYLYLLTDVRHVPPFIPAEGKRHWTTWMEYAGKRVI